MFEIKNCPLGPRFPALRQSRHRHLGDAVEKGAGFSAL